MDGEAVREYCQLRVISVIRPFRNPSPNRQENVI